MDPKPEDINQIDPANPPAVPAIHSPAIVSPHQPLALKKYIVVQVDADNKLTVLTQSDSISVAASEELHYHKPGFPSTFVLKVVKYKYNVEEVQND